MDKQEPVAKFKVGDPVQRAEPRSYLFPGIVIGANLKLDGKTWLYSVECTAPGVEGMVHEFTERALEARANHPADDCPSCHGLNISCPEGCGRDPLTGELNGTTLIRPADDGLVARLEEWLERIQEGDRPLPWVVHSGCSYRRIASEPTPDSGFRSFPDGNVLHAYNQRSDGHPDLSMGEKQLSALVEIVNNLPTILTALRAQSDAEVEREAIRPRDGVGSSADGGCFPDATAPTARPAAR